MPLSSMGTPDSDPKFALEGCPPYSPSPSSAGPDLWGLVQNIGQHAALLSCHNAEEQEYDPLVQKVLGGLNQVRFRLGFR